MGAPFAFEGKSYCTVVSPTSINIVILAIHTHAIGKHKTWRNICASNVKHKTDDDPVRENIQEGRKENLVQQSLHRYQSVDGDHLRGLVWLGLLSSGSGRGALTGMCDGDAQGLCVHSQLLGLFDDG